MTDSGDCIGLKAWVADHKAQTPGNEVLKENIDNWIANFEAEEEERQRAKLAAVAGDGWTVVVRSKGRKRTREENGVSTFTGGRATAAAEEKLKQVRAAKDAAAEKDAILMAGRHDLGQHFYRTHRLDRQRTEVAELQKKFQADQRRLKEMRAAKSLNPFKTSKQ
mmetsp:Transcript_12655/g.22594  ORF Transcript_12655/g.22594 Transcript_12655/m.22594 type:complete len:165 (-) Transcript_12655:539-1033(-)